MTSDNKEALEATFKGRSEILAAIEWYLDRTMDFVGIRSAKLHRHNRQSLSRNPKNGGIHARINTLSTGTLFPSPSDGGGWDPFLKTDKEVKRKKGGNEIKI